MEQKFIDTNSNQKFCLVKYFKSYNLAQWVAFVGLFVFATTYGFTINNFLNYAASDASKIWFGIFDRFTNQSNWMLFIYCFLFLFFKKHSFLKNNGLLISVMVYIFFTFIGYNVVLVGISGDRAYVGDSVAVASNVWVHILAPLYFVFFGLTVMYCYPNQQPKKLWQLILYGMIYPTVYMIYLVTIPFTYTSYTDVNNNPATYSVYGKATNTKDYATSWAYIMVMYLLFFPGSFTLFYYSWIGFNKINNSKKTYI